ncbi:50S ribosomal protein L18 [Methanomassiliicoccus luminyensis]|uniref:50S ribosomal protein L18 n=1 Tax=Methanomassiliicoccus luminyensis TaxID=1080712 RepID=UPI00036D4605|nr:50S ribosomal protein L18 [Methanomassiliicoccus luminyensis]
MATGPRYRVPFRRRREGRTDYRYRQRLLRSRVPRAVVRLSLKNANVQFIAYDEKGDQILAAATSKELPELGWTAATGNLPAAYLTGYLAGKRAAKSGVEEAVLDIGQKVPAKGSNVFAALKGMLDAGIEIPHGEDVIPAEARLKGQHIDGNIEKMIEDVKSRMEAE